MKQQISYLQYDGTISIDSIVQHQQDHKRGGTKDCILFWVTIVSSLVSLIMLFVAIKQLHKQIETSDNNGKSTNKLLKNLNTLIDNQNSNTEKAREDRVKVLNGLRSGVCRINAQIFNNVLTDIAIKKQGIHASCKEICLYFKSNPHILKEDLAIQDPKVLELVNQIENSIATLKEMFYCYGFYNDNCKDTFTKLIAIMDRLRSELGIAPTKTQRDAFFGEIMSSENEMMLAINAAISEMRNIIEDKNE